MDIDARVDIDIIDHEERYIKTVSLEKYQNKTFGCLFDIKGYNSTLYADKDRKVKTFSFCIFVNDSFISSYMYWYNNFESLDISDEKTKKHVEILKNWLNKYFYLQLEKIEDFLYSWQYSSDEAWKNYNVIHLIDDFIWELQAFDNKMNPVGKTFGELYLENTLQLKGYIPIAVKSKNSNIYKNVDQIEKSRFVDYFGSLIRFCPFVWDFLDEVHIRDAHSTMPNTKNNLDYDWLKKWKTTDKKFMMYTAQSYNPSHAANVKVPYAAIWGARKLQDNECISFDIWEKYIEYKGEKDNHSYYKSFTYGVDERRLLFFLQKHMYNITFFIPITHFCYLLTGYNRLRASDKQIVEELKPADKKESKKDHYSADNLLKAKIQTGGINMSRSTLSTPKTYFSEVKCAIKYLLEFMKNKYKVKYITVDLFFDTLKKIKEYEDGSPENMFIKKFAKMIPDSNRIWDYLFLDGIQKKRNMDKYINDSISIVEPDTVFSAACDINSFIFDSHRYDVDDEIEGIESKLKY